MPLFVSVPFRGLCSEIISIGTMKQSNIFSWAFPSPFGVCVLKSEQRNKDYLYVAFSFRPLSGFVF